MILLLPTVKHTGSHFVLKQLLPDFEQMNLKDIDNLDPDKNIVIFDHLYPSKMDLWEPLMAKYPAIIPLRNKQDIMESWERREEPIDDFFDQWQILGRMRKYKVYFINLDAPKFRRMQLRRINQELDLNLDPGKWEKIRA